MVSTVLTNSGVTVWVYGFMSDYFQTRWLIVMGQAVRV